MSAVLEAPVRTATRAPGIGDAVRWEASKLRAQLRTRITLGLCAVAPMIPGRCIIEFVTAVSGL